MAEEEEGGGEKKRRTFNGLRPQTDGQLEGELVFGRPFSRDREEVTCSRQENGGQIRIQMMLIIYIFNDSRENFLF